MKVAELKRPLSIKQKIDSKEQLSFLAECIDNYIVDEEMDATENLINTQVQCLRGSAEQIRTNKIDHIHMSR